LFYAADFTFSRSRRSELHTLREVSLVETHSLLRQDLGRLEQACYCAALVEVATETDTPLPAIFELMRGLLKHVSTRPTGPQTVLAFELKLLDELGLKPDLEQTSLNPGARQIVAALTRSDWPITARLKLSATQETDLGRFLHGFLLYHLGRIPRGRVRALVAFGPDLPNRPTT